MRDGRHDVFASSVGSGEILWTYRANLDQRDRRRVLRLDEPRRRARRRQGILGQLDGKLVALDSEDRRRRVVRAGRTLAGRLRDHERAALLRRSRHHGLRGRRDRHPRPRQSVRRRDGELVWTFYTIPGPGEVGHDTWPQDNELWQHGGASVWHTPAFDPELGLIYFSTGNPGPDFNGAVRAGDNLFSSSIVAVDAKTGQVPLALPAGASRHLGLRPPSPVVLFDLEDDGRTRKGLAQAGKTGWVYILDRTDGSRSSASTSSPCRRNRARLRRDATVSARRRIRPAADRHRARRLPARQRRPDLHAVLDRPIDREARAEWEARTGRQARTIPRGAISSCAPGPRERRSSPPTSDRAAGRGRALPRRRIRQDPCRRSGMFTALDMRTNTLVWQQHGPNTCYSGSAATAGGLVFVGRSDGRLTALDSRNGEQLWAFQTGAGMNAPVSVFEHSGKQYVVAYSAGNMFAGSPRGDSVWLFALDGTLEAVRPVGSRLPSPKCLDKTSTRAG